MIAPGRTRTLIVLVAALSAMTGAGAWRAVAQVGPTTTTAPTTTTTVASATTTTSHPAPTVVPPPKPAPPPPAPKPTAPPAPTTTTTSTPPPPPAKPGGIPPDMQALINSIKRSGASNTSKLIDALRPLQDFGFTLQEAELIGFGHFPVAGDAAYRDDFLEYRAGPPVHLHQGNDVWAQNGTPIRAPFDGTVEYLEDDLGGHGAYVRQPGDGTYVYNAHLSAYAPNLSSGQKVKQGQVIGFVGNTGDAQGGPTHDHFEFHPKGGAAIDPKPVLDGWLNDALANAPALIASYRGTTPRAIVDTGLTRFDLGGGMFSAPSRPAAAPALWASSVSPTGAAVRMAEVEVADTFGDIDWDAWLRDQQAQAAEWGQADDAARNLLAPLTPRALAKFL